MTRSEKEKQSYKLGHSRLRNKTSRFTDLSIKINEMYTTILVSLMSLGIEVNILSLIIHKTFRIRMVSNFPTALS